MSSPANLLTQQVIKFIHEQNGFAFRVNSLGVFDAKRHLYRTAPKKGIADILACHKKIFYAIEIKIGRDTLSPEQIGFLKNVEHAEGRALVIHSFEDFLSQWQQQNY